MAPPSQKFRRIGFYLEGGPTAPVQFYFGIRPEQLSRNEPSRLTVTQTLGGAYADAFGAGLATITLNGHNGWRGGFLSSGEDAFAQLRSTIFQDWHDRRQACITGGLDPSEVTLTITDDLDQIDQIVAPRSFVLNRSKTSPLLMRYQATLIVLGDANSARSLLDQITLALSNPLRWLAGVTGMTDVLNQVSQVVATASNAYGALSGAVSAFVNTGVSVMNEVSSVASTLQGDFSGSIGALLTAGLSYSAAAANALSALGLDPGLPPDQLLPAAQLASMFVNLNCLMANCFTSDKSIIDIDGLLGASGCSSTGGGDPASQFTLIGANPFETLFVNNATTPVQISATASQAMATLLGDPIALIGQDAAVGYAMQLIAAGVTVTPT